jgi:hypothetical protein
MGHPCVEPELANQVGIRAAPDEMRGFFAARRMTTSKDHWAATAF